MRQDSLDPSITVLGIDVHQSDICQVVDQVMAWTSNSGVHVAVGINANVCNLAAADAEFAYLITQADLRYADGQSVVWAMRLLGGRLRQRVATTDLIVPLADRAEREDKRLFLYGAAPGVSAAAAERLREHHPRLQIDSHHGFASAAEMPEVLAAITRHRTDILLVGTGDPHQHRWIAMHRQQLTTPAVLTCGGLFDWVSGKNRRAPGWMIRSGLEWLWRLVIEPRRLAKRYLVGNPQFVARLAKQLVLLRRSQRRQNTADHL